MTIRIVLISVVAFLAVQLGWPDSLPLTWRAEAQSSATGLFQPPQAFAQMGMMGGMRKHGSQEQGVERRHSRRRHNPFGIAVLKEVLSLNEGQVTKMKRLRTAYAKETIAKQAALRIAGLELSELLDQPSLDLKKIEQKLTQIGSLQAELGMARVRKLVDAQEFLTKKQFTKFRAYAQGMAGRMDRMMSSGRTGRMMGHQKRGGPEEYEE